MSDPYTGERVPIEYVFQVGAPLIQFDNSAMVPACGLTIPVIGGSVTNPKMNWTIDAGVYYLHITGIALASVKGNEISRDPKPSDQPFVFDSPNTTGAVTLDLDTAASKKWLKIDLKGHQELIPLIDNNLGNLNGKILTFFETSSNSIHWDLAQVNNSRPSTGSTQLVPEFFRFATYSPSEESDYTILSIFIHVSDHTHGGIEDQLQSRWTTQWSEYKVPPIPESYTASIIFNNAWMKDMVKKSVENAGMKIEEIPKTTDDKWGLKWKILTHMTYNVKRFSESGSQWPYSRFSVEAVSVDLDNRAEGLYLSIGQNVRSMLRVISDP